ncbi:MAG: fadD11 [Mycobacterium sp.]|nr:fadD11 [Mycobacterium sp.]
MTATETLTLCDAFQANVQRYSERVALRTPGDAVQVTWRAYGDRVRSIATGLAGLGVGPGETVALMLTNRPEFHLCDTAVLHTGATPFSMYNTNPPEMLAYLFGNAEPRVVVREKQFVPQILAAAQLGGKIEHVICVDGEPDGTVTLASVEAKPAEGFDFDSVWRAVKPSDVLTIVYTSGTTGPPKGVELTHANFIANAELLDEMGGVGVDDRVVSYLPDAHAANRWVAHYANLLRGIQITTVADPKDVIEALTDARPTFFMGVPRIWMKVKAALESSVADEPSTVKRALASWALNVGQQKARYESDRKPVPLPLKLQHAAAERLVLSRVRAKLGLDHVRIGASGAAPIPPEVHLFMLGLGIVVCEAWGMSELTAVATVNRPTDIRVGTVGQVVGEQRSYIVALLTLDPEAVKAFAEKHALANTSIAQLHAHPAIMAEIEAGIAAANAKLARVEQIKKYTILPDVWEPGSELVTPTMKLKRKSIVATYASEIETLYS